MSASFSHFNLTRIMVVGERVTCAPYSDPEYVSGVSIADHDFYWFFIVLAPEDCSSQCERNLIHCAGMMIRSVHDAIKIGAEFFDFGNGESHESPFLVMTYFGERGF